MIALAQFLSGCAMLGAWVGGVYFFKFWFKTKDRLFFMFGTAFWLMALERLVLIFMAASWREEYSYLYLIRSVAFLIIIAAIVDKNRKNA